MEANQVAIKVYATDPSGVASERLIPVFHRWIHVDRLGSDKVLIDVADYSHVPNGPGVMIIGHEGHYGMDREGGRFGLLFARKRDAPGPLAGRLKEALVDALTAAVALEEEPALALRFRGDALTVRIMNRLCAPNEAATFEAARPALDDVLTRLLGTAVTLSHRADARGPFTVDVASPSTATAADLLERARGL